MQHSKQPLRKFLAITHLLHGKEVNHSNPASSNFQQTFYVHLVKKKNYLEHDIMTALTGNNIVFHPLIKATMSLKPQQAANNLNDARTIWTNETTLVLLEKSPFNSDHVLLWNAFRYCNN